MNDRIGELNLSRHALIACGVAFACILVAGSPLRAIAASQACRHSPRAQKTFATARSRPPTRSIGAAEKLRRCRYARRSSVRTARISSLTASPARDKNDRPEIRRAGPREENGSRDRPEKPRTARLSSWETKTGRSRSRSSRRAGKWFFDSQPAGRRSCTAASAPTSSTPSRSAAATSKRSTNTRSEARRVRREPVRAAHHQHARQAGWAGLAESRRHLGRSGRREGSPGTIEQGYTSGPSRTTATSSRS